MQGFKEPSFVKTSRGFDIELSTYLKSKLQSTIRNSLPEGISLFGQDSRQSDCYVDSILKAVYPYQEKQTSQQSAIRSQSKIRDFSVALKTSQENNQILLPSTRKPTDGLLARRSKMDIYDTTSLFQKYNGDFDSDNESFDKVHVSKLTPIKIEFLSSENAEKCLAEAKSAIDFKGFINSANQRFERSKTYECEVCKQKFEKHAALGGHMSKIHPRASKKFEERMNVYALRKGEREKRQFLINLGGA